MKSFEILIIENVVDFIMNIIIGTLKFYTLAASSKR